MPTEPEPQDDQEIVEKVNYLTTVLIPSIKAINDSILNGKDSRDATENLYTDLLSEWRDEIKDQVDKINKEYNNTLEIQNSYLVKGIRHELKDDARRKINNAEKKYSRDMKSAILNLVHKKIGLFQTKRKIEHGYLSLYQLGEGEKEDE